jgi:hypothetical protein
MHPHIILIILIRDRLLIMYLRIILRIHHTILHHRHPDLINGSI